MKYRVEKQCFWGRVYEMGEIVNVDQEVPVPSHFKPLDVPKKNTPKPVKRTEKTEA